MTHDELKEKILREVKHSHERLTKRRVAVRLGQATRDRYRYNPTAAFNRAYAELLQQGSIHEFQGVMDEPIVQIEPPVKNTKASFSPASEPPLTVRRLEDLEAEDDTPIAVPIKKKVAKTPPAKPINPTNPIEPMEPQEKPTRTMRSSLELHRAINVAWNELLEQEGTFSRSAVLRMAETSNSKRGPVVEAMDAAICRLVTAGWSKEARDRERDVPIRAHDALYGSNKKPNPRRHQRKVTPEQLRALEVENELLQTRLNEALSSPETFLWKQVESCNESIAELQQQRQELAEQITALAKQRDSLMGAIQALENPVQVAANGRGSGRLELKEAG